MVSSLPPGYIFSFFTGMMCLQLLWVITMVPETKNIPLEELQGIGGGINPNLGLMRGQSLTQKKPCSFTTPPI